MKKTILILFSVLYCLLMKAGAQQPSTSLTLKQAIDIALTNNLEARQSEALVQASLIRKKQSRFDLLPDLSGNASHGINEGRSIDPFTNSYINQKINFGNYSLGSTVLLFNGLQLQHTLKQNSFSYEASKMEWQQLKDNLTMNVILAYLQLLSAQEQLSASRNQVEVTRKQVERLGILNKEGAVQPALLYDLQGQLANDELSVLDRQNAIAMARLTLAQLMNLPFNKDLQVEPVHAEVFSYDEGLTVEKVYHEALQKLAVIKATAFRRAAATAGVKAAKGGYFPSLVINGNIFTNYSSAASREILMNVFEKPSSDYIDIGGSKYAVIRQQASYNSEKISYSSQFNNNYSSSVSIGLRVPILNGFRTRNQVALAKIDLSYATYVAESSRIQLKQQVEQVHFNMTAAYAKYTILNNQVKSFAESFRIAEVKFNAGVGTQVDYLIAKNNLDRANINLIIARYDYILRKKLLDFYYGSLSL